MVKTELPYSLMFKKNLSISPKWNLNEVLFKFSPFSKGFTISDAVRGVQIFGGTGSGKTSGSAKKIAISYLKAGFGGLVLCAKKDEMDLWKSLCNEAGRSDSLVEFSLESVPAFSLNFLEIAQNEFKDVGAVYNILQLIKVAMGQNVKDLVSQGDGDFHYWEAVSNQLLSHVIAVCLYSDKTFTIDLVRDIVQCLPKEGSETNQFFKNIENSTPTNHLEEVLVKNRNSKIKNEDILLIERWLYAEYSKHADKTRGSLISSVTSSFDSLLREPFKSLLFNGRPITPEWCFAGGIIVVNVPVHQYEASGKLINLIWKYIFQKAAQKRDVSQKLRPTFLWADEAHHFVSHFDSEFQTTARAQMIATVYITQNLSNYRKALGSGSQGDDSTLSLLGNLSNKIYHSNPDLETNTKASKEIGKGWIKRKKPFIFNDLLHTDDKELRPLKIFEYFLQPEDFSQLASGGSDFKWLVEGVVHSPGSNRFGRKKDFKKCRFYQKKEPFYKRRNFEHCRPSVDFHEYIKNF